MRMNVGMAEGPDRRSVRVEHCGGREGGVEYGGGRS